eukprot:Nitzschia sp. Nitz4//scaffold4_size323378//231579//232169//NITZ4_000691-RA/size323378-processed-gene-0.299-mRNA-1//1//CDS//3329553492//1579//frame0
MGGATGYSTSFEGKQARVQAIRDLLEDTNHIFSVPSSALTVREIQDLKRSLPDDSTLTISVVKNSVMQRAMEGTPFQPAETLLRGSNMWFFVKDEEIGPALQVWKDFLKEKRKSETHAVLGGFVEGTVYGPEDMATLATLPSRLELYTKFAMAIKGVPTRLGMAIKAPTEQLARGIKMALVPDGAAPEKGSEAPAE